MNVNKKKLYDSYVSSGQVINILDKDKNPESYFRNRSKFINSIIRKFIKNQFNTNAEIIDIACGHGAFVYFLNKSGFRNVKGFDISNEQIELGQNLNIENIYCMDIFQHFQENPNKVDIVLLIDIIEHLRTEETIQLLELLHNRLKKGGIIIIHVPNAEGLFGMRIRYGDMTHETAFTPNSMSQLLKTAGFTKVECFEDKPIIHGFKSLIRRVIWDVFTLYSRILLMAETGETKFILSQNMTIVTSEK